MKRKTILNVFSGLCAILVLTNCGGSSDNEGPTLSVSPTNVILEDNGSGQSINVTSNTDWTVTSDDTWLTCKPAGGKGGANITVSASVNTGEERYSKLTFVDKTGRATAEVRVTQKAGAPQTPTVSVQPTSITLEADGTAQTISVSSNTSWTVRADDSWLIFSPTSGSGSNSITVHATVNTGEERSTKLYITDTTNKASAEVRVTQKAPDVPTPTLDISINSLSFYATGGNDSFTITSNTSWTVSSDQTWCTVSPLSGSNNGTVTVKVDENKETTTRSANITIKYDNKSVTISVSQAAADISLTVSPTSLSFTENGGSEKITISSNTSWNVSSKQSWCTVSPTSGSNNGTVTVTVSANDSNSDRTATVTITDASNSVKREVSIIQAAKTESTSIGHDGYGDDINLDNK